MGQIAGFQETLRRVAMFDEGFVEDQAGPGLAVLIVRFSGAVDGRDQGMTGNVPVSRRRIRASTRAHVGWTV
jgi:hypothetical protein